MSVLLSDYAFAFGLTADQMYRNLIETESGDALTKRLAQEKNVDDPYITFKKEHPHEFVDEIATTNNDKSQFIRQEDWKEIVSAVRSNSITPFQLDEIQKLSENDNSEAIELLAWMYATGTGIKQDLVKSYTFYLKASYLGIPTAQENMKSVYRSMSPDQKKAIPKF
ncbi:MAG: hypothetical protein MJ247_05000 [Alphaproteobacteria bacterium]|nr:hypothetical protein [Alphaproteobacteria bacterium]